MNLGTLYFSIRTSRLGNAAGIFALVLYVSALGLRTRLRSGDWTTERPLFLEALRITQGNAKCYSNVGHTYEGEGDHETALGYFYLATRVQSNDRGAWINVGNALRELGRLDEAVQVYQAVLDTFPVAEEGQILKVKMAAKDLVGRLLISWCLRLFFVLKRCLLVYSYLLSQEGIIKSATKTSRCRKKTYRETHHLLPLPLSDAPG